jgi:hypothetical protein
VSANFHTDDYAFNVEFDCRAYLAATDVKYLLEIIEVGYSGDTATDSVGEFFGDKNLNEEIAAGFTYLRALPNRSEVGFEVRIDAESFLRWMDLNHQAALAKYLCDQDGEIHIMRAEEDELRGMWDWIGPNGNACEYSLETKEAAYLDAYITLELLDEAIANS